MVIYITGASGYLGSALAKYFADLGDYVIALSRNNTFNHSNIEFSHFSLGDIIDKALPIPDVCIHCAYDLKATKWSKIYKTNILGSQSLIEQLAILKCKSIIHISSISAFEGCRSQYGQAKLLIEQITSKYNGISIRPGLIYGGSNSGLIGKLSSISKSPIIPMIGRGHYPQYLTQIDNLCRIIHKIVRKKYQLDEKVITLCSKEAISLKNIIKNFSRSYNALIIPVYWRIPYCLLKCIEMLNIRFSLKSDSIKSLVFSNLSPNFSFMEKNNVNF